MIIPEDAIRHHIENAEYHLPKPDDSLADRFCPISLGDWLDLCRQAGIPHVPARKVTTLLREDCLSFDTRGEHQDRLKAAFQEMSAAEQHLHMMRFDCCASLEVKYHMSKGEPYWKPEFDTLILDDPRAFDIIIEYPREELPVWQRPWTDALVYDSYPVEYQAFVNNGTITSISSYYPQRKLIEFPEHIRKVREYTCALARTVQAPFLWSLAYKPPEMRADGIHFTADFMATKEGILFLEGGPPHEMGAHPCCFQPGRIEGIALEDRNEEPVY